MGKVKFYVLDALRGIAAIFVVVRHSGEFFGGNPFYNSFLAVDIFFLLSGFVIAHAYDKKLISNIIDSREFITIRLIRFYPAYILSILLCLVALLIKQTEYGYSTVGNFLLTLFFIPNFFQSLVSSSFLFPINGVFWSLFYELGMNIIYAVTRKLEINKLLALFTVLSGLAILSFGLRNGSLDAGFRWGTDSIILGGTRAFFGIFFGIYLYKIRNHKAFNYLEHFSTIGPLLFLVAILSMEKLSTFNWLYQVVSILLLFPIIVLWASKAKSSRASKTLTLLGLMSYPAYVLHRPLKEIVNNFMATQIQLFAPYSGVLFLAVLIILCIIVEKYYERPIIKYLKQNRRADS
jgi:peptidoglycan/LPS O-acetylase OafA/YrhL